METTVIERIRQFIKEKGFSVKEFERMVGMPNGNVGKIKYKPSEQVTEKILLTFPELNKVWLLTGEGSMMNTKQPAMTPSADGIPLIPTNAIGGVLSGIDDSFMEYECERYIVPQFKGADFLIRVQGDSMMPKYVPGDIVACKKVTDRIWFQWGKAYVVDTRQGVLIKRVEPSKEEGCICLHSENPSYKPFDLPSDELHGLAIVCGVIRVE